MTNRFHPPLTPFEQRLAAAWPPETWADLTVLAAVSGGADSVALFRALTRLRAAGDRASTAPGRLCVGHYNHGLRGHHSAAEQQFVIDLCKGAGVECFVGRADARAWNEAARDGLENTARTLRYDFFLRTAQHCGARYLVTAHTADDQAETILHRIVRGTGIAGLSGMSRARMLSPAVTLLRPMLGLRRCEVLEYLSELGQPFRHDLSNLDTRFTRNRIRHELIPKLAVEFNPSVVEAVLRLGNLAGQLQGVVDALVAALVDRAVTTGTAAPQVRIELGPLAGQPRYLVRELMVAVWRERNWPLQAMGHAQWELLADMAIGPGDAPAKLTFPGRILAEWCEGVLLLQSS